MNVVFMTGNHPRHAAVARKLDELDCLSGLVIAEREAHVPQPPDSIPADTAELFRHHFETRAKSEEKFFQEIQWPAVQELKIPGSAINSGKIHEFLAAQNPTLLLSYGIPKLTAQTLAYTKNLTWNIHGGLTPWYRGAITHFWPSYFLEPQMTGMTVHELAQQIDGGAVIHQSVAEMVRGDGLHDISCRAVKGLIDELPTIIEAASNPDGIRKKFQTTSGRIWRGSDWRPEHLHLIYGHFGDRIVDRYLEGQFSVQEPKIHRIKV